jgi:class 3 adenylate cyclase
VLRAIDEFLGEGEPAATELPEGMAVILFADIAESTALTERMGDAAFRSKARELDVALRSVIRECAGTPVEGKVLGDGVLAVFTSARQAIECALRCNAASQPVGLQLHLGIHAGDVIREEDPDGRANVYGGAVNIAARIAAASAPGEVLVSDTVRGLARTSAGVTFDDRGEQTLKGVADPQRLFAVREGNA